ncbi:AP2/B3-like transcriptional factor family protein [Arabidopsis thaliana]|uniref:B3 domain-containing transcription factor FUS3 n=1 Tax=Arabidopsis thaliana TaxID=3702 RepID=FUS3_ARATH|nr:AP2/B3-like transcriptional factor family protein [Arabidopsis thaliana]Q9LW31.2 RecName: Full=B3 domain-containing transcription factor FUS3; AltName: Full=Protein FUSCA3 [Arabidopsis thaliana]AEE77216.1 AP2/B3-like transcriptional factor family protein [Arabidopsis thaliana]|eukprot:NP_566799.1 AP2/B3-like transcriptional factor family protein [Arabidopsis thaliana]
MMVDENVETKASTLVASVDHGFGSGSGHDHHGLSASVPLLGVNWKKRRMPRQRRSSSSFNLLSFPPPMPPISHVPTPLPARKIDPRKLRFLFQKELKNSDVSSLRRMILPKKAAEAHLPALECKEGIPIRMEDLDGFHVWTFKYRYWPNNNSRMYVLENTGDFVNAHGLQLGDFIMVYQDLYSNNYVIQARKASEEEEVDVINLEEDDVYTNLTRIENTVVNDLLLQDFNHHNNNNNNNSNSNSNKCSYYYPVIDDVTTNTESFVYDTTALTSNDTPLDFLGGHTTTTNNYYSKFGTFDGLGSVENISLDDFY